VLRCRGLLGTDPRMLSDAVDVYCSSPRPFERALACQDAATALAQTGHVDQARALFDEALQTYERLGAGYHIAKATQTMRAYGIRKGKRGARKRPATGWAALTDTELRVAKLAAEGLTNSQIAQRLFVSHHTVATHLAHIFDKLGINSKVELAAHATRHTG
jgi:DNA-binding CsgD family transcriptional regulator